MELWIVLFVEAGECETAVKFYTQVFGRVQIHRRSTSDEQSPILSAALKFGGTNVILKEQLEEEEVEDGGSEYEIKPTDGSPIGTRYEMVKSERPKGKSPVPLLDLQIDQKPRWITGTD